MEKEKLTFRQKMKAITSKTAQVYIAMKHPQTPWYAKALGLLTIGYALSPIDLIPDFIPVLGYLDDLIILPLLVGLCIKLIPKDIWEASEAEAQAIWQEGRPTRWYLAIPIVILWLVAAFFLVRWILTLSK